MDSTERTPRRAYRKPELEQYGRIDRLTRGSGGGMLDFSAVTFQFLGDQGACQAADGLTCFVSG